MTIVGLDFCLPSDAAERVSLYYRVSPPHLSVDPYPDWYGCSPGIYPHHGCSPGIYPPAHRVYTRITPVALGISLENTHIKPIIGHSINTGTHMYIFVRLYTRITPIALVIYEDSTHINPGMGHGINTGTHMCIFVRIVGLSTTSMVECLFLTKG